MRKRLVARDLALAVILAGIIVAAGWVFGIPALTSIHPQLVTMKFSTAVSFVLSGVILLCVVSFASRFSDWILFADATAVILLALIMGSLLLSSFAGVVTGIESLGIVEDAKAIHTTVPGRPSLLTMTAFLLVAAEGIAVLLAPRAVSLRRLCGAAVLLAGAAAVLGYLLGIPALYGEIPGKSTAMALHTAVLFMLLGAGFAAPGMPGKE
ncbi:MAG TPA: hypothetical protein P5287_00750 [bacterium]|nr:hypothetical protein [bacterium]